MNFEQRQAAEARIIKAVPGGLKSLTRRIQLLALRRKGMTAAQRLSIAKAIHAYRKGAREAKSNGG